MESISLGELILNHYEKFLGNFEDVFFKGIDDMPSIQILQYGDIFKGCKTYVSYGLSKYSNVIGNLCEVIMSIDDDYEKAARLFTHSLLGIIKDKIELDKGIYIYGLDRFDKAFTDRHKKNGIYFTETYMYPYEFSYVNEMVKMYSAFFISQEECDFINKYGGERFEDYLEEINCDIMDLNR